MKAETGRFKLYTEGLDNDGDGLYNEDGPGGVNIADNFPHLFKPFTATGGGWAGSESESFALFRFVFEHTEIAMAIHLGESNFCLNPPVGGRKGSPDLSKIKIPERIGKRMNIDTSRTYTMKEIMEMVQQFVPSGFQITESMVASFLGLGAAVNPQPADLKFYQELSERYKDYLKKNKVTLERLEPAKAKDGSFELWAYYHLGLPSFSLDFWTVPKPEKKDKKGPELTPDKLEQMSNEEFLALGEEKIAAFLKASGAPPGIKAPMIMNGIKNGMMDTKKMAAMMRQMPKPKSKEGGDPAMTALVAYSDKELNGKGFVPWTPYKHPTLGQVEVGGAAPYVFTTPPQAKIQELLTSQVPWLLDLAGKLARIKIVKTKTENLGEGVYRVKAWIENSGYLPYPTAMGRRNSRIPPVVVVLHGGDIELLQGKKRSLIKEIPGKGRKMVQWLLYSKVPKQVKLETITANAWRDSEMIRLGGNQ